jgi:hypothetical protein
MISKGKNGHPQSVYSEFLPFALGTEAPFSRQPACGIKIKKFASAVDFLWARRL